MSEGASQGVETLSHKQILAFLNAFQKESSSLDFKPQVVGLDSTRGIKIGGAAAGALGILNLYLDGYFPEKEQLLLETLERKLGISIKETPMENLLRPRIDRRVELTPVDLESLDYANNPYFRHDGYLHVGRKSNLKNLAELGIFGDPRQDFPTYIQFGSSAITPSGWGDPTNRGPISIFLSAKALGQKRSVFVDPETIVPNEKGDVLGQSFMVLGGIPKEAIVGYSTIGHPEPQVLI